MADKKISQLTDGTSLQSGDFVVVARSGNNFKVDPTQFGSDISLGDNVKATFGDSSDLQIFHDGNNSYITDVGTGSIWLKTNGPNISFLDSSNNYMIRANTSGAVDLYNNSSKKLSTTATGIDVTGTVTADGASLDGAVVINESGAAVDFRVEGDTDANLIFVDGSADTVFIGTTTNDNSSKLVVNGTISETVGGTQYEVVSASDIGTDPNQVPLNQYLGSMAYQDLDAVSITGGTATLDELILGDNAKAIFGDGADLQIYHDGSNSIISDVGTGNLDLKGSAAVYIKASGTDESMAAFVKDGGVYLYHNNAQKLETTATGIDVTGTVTADGLTSDVADGTSFAANFNHTGGTVGRNGIKITSSGTSGTSTLIEALRNTTNTVFKVDGSGTLILNDQSGNQNHSLNVTGAVVFNDQGADADFRVESDGASHMLFVDAGNNRVGIGEASPDNPLHVTTSSAGDILTLESTDAGTGVGPSINLYRNSGSPAANDLGPAIYFRGENSVGGQHTYANIYSQFNNVTDGSEDVSVFHQISIAGTPRSVLSLKNSEVVINDESQNVDFRVESDTNANALFVEGSSGNVGIGTSSPTTGLECINSDGQITGRSSKAANTNASLRFMGGAYTGNTATAILLDGVSGSNRLYLGGGTSLGEPATFIAFMTGTAGSTGAGSERARIDDSGNLLVGGTGTPTSSVGNFVLYNGTAPTGNATDGVILYAEDVSASSELKVRDEAGNVTTLSPHNFDLIPEGPSEDMAWSYYSERDGKRINVDMLKAIRLLEQLSGEKLVHIV